MNTWNLLLPVPLVAAFCLLPQDPEPASNAAPAQVAPTDVTAIVRASEIQYVDYQGQSHAVSARTVVEVRLLEDVGERIRLEILYENGDYSMIDAQAFHVLRSGRDLMDVRLVRSGRDRLRFPKM